MRKFIPQSFPIILSWFILNLFSCTPGSCFEETESLLKTSFYNSITKKLHAPDSLTIFGLDMESNLLYNKTPKVQKALMPLNASKTNCIYIIKINETIDTLKLFYSSYPHLISKECGYTFYYDLAPDSLAYTTNTIDSIYITNNIISTINGENIRIFY